MSTANAPHSGQPVRLTRRQKRRKQRDRQAVYLVEVPNYWRPQRPWDMPPILSGGRLHAKNLAMGEALAFARVHNQTKLQASYQRQPVGQWAIVVKHQRPRVWRDATAEQLAGNAADGERAQP